MNMPSDHDPGNINVLFVSRQYIGINEARPKLGDLITAAQQGADVIITRNGKPAVRLIPCQEGAMRRLTDDEALAGWEASNDLKRGPILEWNTLTGAVRVVAWPGWPKPTAVIAELGTVRVIGGDYGPWSDGFWTEPIELAAQHGWHIDPHRPPDGINGKPPWRGSVNESCLYRAGIDRTASAYAMQRHAQDLAAAGIDHTLVGFDIVDGQSVPRHNNSATP